MITLDPAGFRLALALIMLGYLVLLVSSRTPSSSSSPAPTAREEAPGHAETDS